VVFAQDSAEAGEGVALQLAGPLVLAQGFQGEAEEAQTSGTRVKIAVEVGRVLRRF
jgi:hypothetical protein